MAASKNRYDAKYEITGPADGGNDDAEDKDKANYDIKNFNDGNMMDDLEALDDMDRADTRSNDSYKESEQENVNAFENIQEKLFEIIEGEEVEDVIDLNEKFLVQ